MNGERNLNNPQTSACFMTACCTLADCTHETCNEEQKIKNAKRGGIYLDLFSGIGGFAKGFDMAGFTFDKHYFSEIDKNAIANYKYNFKNAEYAGDIRTIFTGTITDRPNLITFGFPCQDLSVAGKGKGLSGARSGLFYEAVRLIEEFKPDVFIFENVKGLLSSNKGKDFELVLRTIADIGLYECEWQLLNTAWLLPQNRERVYFVGHRKTQSIPRIFPIFVNKKIDYEDREEMYEVPKRIIDRIFQHRQKNERWTSVFLQSMCKIILQGISSQECSKNNTTASELRLFTKGSLQKDMPYEKRTQSSYISNGFHKLVQFPKKDMLLLWLRGKEFKDSTGQIQQQDLQAYDRQDKFFETLSEGKFSSCLFTVQSYKGRLFYSIGNGSDWFNVYQKEMGERFNLKLSDILEDSVDESYFLSSKQIKGLMKGNQSPQLIENTESIVRTITAGGHSGGHHSGMTLIQRTDTDGNRRPQGYRCYKSDGISPALSSQQGGIARGSHIISHYGHKNKQATEHTICPTLKAQSHGHEPMVKAVLTPNRLNKRQNWRRFKNNGEPSFTLNTQDQMGIQIDNQIRRLTEIECERLQGFPDNWTMFGDFDGTIKEISRTQRYKMLGNAVTTKVIEMIAMRI
jgi:DNA-cytosine methyltransferase